jgi:hypothetical protein
MWIKTIRRTIRYGEAQRRIDLVDQLAPTLVSVGSRHREPSFLATEDYKEQTPSERWGLWEVSRLTLQISAQRKGK